MQVVLALCMAYNIAKFQEIIENYDGFDPSSIVLTAEHLYLDTWVNEEIRLAAYVAPECLKHWRPQAKDSRYAGYTADVQPFTQSVVWTFAAVMVHAAMGGNPAFCGETAGAIAEQLQWGQHRILQALQHTEMDNTLRNLLAECLQLSPDQRPMPQQLHQRVLEYALNERPDAATAHHTRYEQQGQVRHCCGKAACTSHKWHSCQGMSCGIDA